MAMITIEELMRSEIRALSWKQPYAELMKHGKQETRTWTTPYRGLVLICASVVPYGDRELVEIAGPDQYSRIIQTLGVQWFNQVKRGNAIAVGRLVNCAHSKDWLMGQVHAWEKMTFTKFTGQNWVHIYEDVTPIQPFPWRGSLGWKTLTPDEKSKIKLL